MPAMASLSLAQNWGGAPRRQAGSYSVVGMDARRAPAFVGAGSPAMASLSLAQNWGALRRQAGSYRVLDMDVWRAPAFVGAGLPAMAV
ncbi:hypothetical protein BK634_10445 [Pseudomonas chlororaphis]|nr:hypothetical protein BK634_10445 [Pseudomonas chlororaphis]